MITEMYWLIFGAIATVASAVASPIITWTKAEGIWRQVIAWISAIALTFAAWGLQFIPALGDPAWLWVGLQGVCVGLVSNGIYDVPFIKKLYALIFGETKSTTKEVTM